MRRTFTTFLLLTISVVVSIGWCVQENVFIAERKNQKITVQIKNGVRHLTYDQINHLTITTQNIGPQSLSASAPGLRLLKGDNLTKTSLWELTPTRKSIKNDTLKLWVAVRNENDSVWKPFFKIPVQ